MSIHCFIHLLLLLPYYLSASTPISHSLRNPFSLLIVFYLNSSLHSFALSFPTTSLFKSITTSTRYFYSPMTFLPPLPSHTYSRIPFLAFFLSAPLHFLLCLFTVSIIYHFYSPITSLPPLPSHTHSQIPFFFNNFLSHLFSSVFFLFLCQQAHYFNPLLLLLSCHRSASPPIPHPLTNRFSAFLFLLLVDSDSLPSPDQHQQPSPKRLHATSFPLLI